MNDTTRDEPLTGLAEFLRAVANSAGFQYGPLTDSALIQRPETLHRWAAEVESRRAACSSLPDGPVAERQSFDEWWNGLVPSPYYPGIEREIALHAWKESRAALSAVSLPDGGAAELPRHKFWGAGEPDCPEDLKAANGELIDTRCKVCGDDWKTKSEDVCFGAQSARKPTAWMHTVKQRGGDGSTDHALSFLPDNFPLQGDEHGMFYSIGTPVPLYVRAALAAPSAQPPVPTETREYTDGTTATGSAPLPLQSPAQQDAAVTPAKHDYPACAIFRGGKCTCDEADKLCPKCGSKEWDRVDAERGRERDVPFNRCGRCENEWTLS